MRPADLQTPGEAFIDMIEAFMALTKEEQETYLRVLKSGVEDL